MKTIDAKELLHELDAIIISQENQGVYIDEINYSDLIDLIHKLSKKS